MEKVNITYDVHVVDYFNKLIFTLFEQNYFSDIEVATTYVNDIYNFINTKIFIFPHKITPPKLHHLGKNYIFYKSNRRTTWFIFFDNIGDDYFISSILNNNCEETNFLN